MTINGLRRYLKNPKSIITRMGAKGLLNWLPDKQYLKIMYKLKLGKKLNLDNPQTFNEKLQWLKLYDRNPLYTKLSDKYEVRKYIAEKIGAEYLIPLVGGPWDSFDEIDFDALPNQFVLKCTHDSGSVVICRDKSSFDVNSAKQKLTHALRRNYYTLSREWQYKGIPRKIICEQLMKDGVSESLIDYKLLCFNGKVQCTFVCTGRNTDSMRVTFLDNDWTVMPVERRYQKSQSNIEKPKCFSEMMKLAGELSANIPFLRVDLYEIEGRIYFSELTFFPAGGFKEFIPEEWDLTLGSWLQLPEKETQS